ncbi:MAG: alpha/beta fold hydrolase [Cyanobacteria bacterium J06560_5]
MVGHKKGWRLLLTIVSAYFLLCFGLGYFQTRLMFFPPRQLQHTSAEWELAYEDLWLDVPSGQVHGWWIPAAAAAAPTVLFLHGNSSNMGDSAARSQLFHQWGYSTLLIDYRGYGRSSGPFPYEQQLYEDAEAAWDYLIQQRAMGPSQIVLFGHSLGGAIAFYLASEHPTVAGVVAESSFTHMRAMVTQKLRVILPPLGQLLTQDFDSLKRVRSLFVPVLLIHGTADTEVPPAMSQRLYDALPANTYPSRKQLLWITHGGHSNLPTVGGDRYAQAIRSFIERYAK